MAQQNLPDLVVLSPEWIAEVRSRCAAFAENPFAKRWGRSRDMLRQDAHFIPQLLDEIEKLQRHVAFLERSLVTSEKQVAKLSEELDCV